MKLTGEDLIDSTDGGEIPSEETDLSLDQQAADILGMIDEQSSIDAKPEAGQSGGDGKPGTALVPSAQKNLRPAIENGFSTAAKYWGPHWKLDAAEAEALTEGVALTLQESTPALEKVPAWVGLCITAATIVGGRLLITINQAAPVAEQGPDGDQRAA